jgi:hypothetical protein
MGELTMATKTKTTSKASSTKATKKAAASTAAKPTAKAKKAATAETNSPAASKLSQIAAAERVLAESKEPMTCKAMVEAMSAKGYWSSPGGKTPEATLYASLLRQIRDKGADATFQKTGRGLFALNR